MITEEVFVNGRSFDVPPWVDKETMRSELESDSGSAFSYMTSCNFFITEFDIDYETNMAVAEHDFFEIEFVIPLSHCVEIAHRRFFLERRLKDIVCEIRGDNLYFSGVFGEYRNFSSTTVMSFLFSADNLMDNVIIEEFQNIDELVNLDDFNRREIIDKVEKFEFKFFSNEKDINVDYGDGLVEKVEINGNDWLIAVLIYND